MREAKLIRYKDAHLTNYIWFWVIDNIRISPIYDSEEIAKSWGGTPIELT